MIENINYNVKTWDWKSQNIWVVNEWDEAIPVPVLIWRIERWYYQTKEIELNLEVFNLTSFDFTCSDIFQFLTHLKLVENADLKYPIILNRRWQIVDWKHRVCKAILQGQKSIKWIMVIDSDIF